MFYKKNLLGEFLHSSKVVGIEIPFQFVIFSTTFLRGAKMEEKTVCIKGETKKLSSREDGESLG